MRLEKILIREDKFYVESKDFYSNILCTDIVLDLLGFLPRKIKVKFSTDVKRYRQKFDYLSTMQGIALTIRSYRFRLNGENMGITQYLEGFFKNNNVTEGSFKLESLDS